jgi:hypothetical protein
MFRVNICLVLIALGATFAVGLQGAEGTKWNWNNYPKEEIPPLTEALKTKVSNRAFPQVKIEKDQTGTYKLMVDGQYVPFMGMQNDREKLDSQQIGTMRETNVPIVIVKINSAYYSQRRGYVAPTRYSSCFWDGKDKFNPDTIDSVLWRVLQCYPDAKIILSIDLDTYPEWCGENPTEIMRNYQGVPFIVNTHFIRTGNDPKTGPGKIEHFVNSPFSEKYLTDVTNATKRFVEEVGKRSVGRAVIGYFLTGGQDAQLYNFQPPTSIRLKNPAYWGDYSIHAQKAFRTFLAGKYQTIQHLNQAWNSRYESFDKIVPPSPESMIGTTLLRNPETEQLQINFHHFIATSRNGVILKVAEMIKKTSGHPVIVGVWGGESACRSDLTANYPLLRSEHLDFFNHQVTYGYRLPPNLGGINAILGSYQANGKIFQADTDHRSYLILPEKFNMDHISVNSVSVGMARNMAELSSMWRREMGRLWCEGAGAMFHKFGGPWAFEDEPIKKELKELFTASHTGIEFNRNLADLAVIYDERSIDFLAQGIIFHSWWANVQMRELEASGVPFHAYYAEDLKEGRVPAVKAYLFINQLQLDAAMIQAISKLQNNNRTLIFMQGAGYANPEISPDGLKKITGFKLGRLREMKEPASSGKVSSAHPLTRELDFTGTRTAASPENFLQGNNGLEHEMASNKQFAPGYLLHPYSAGALAVNDPDAMILATYPATKYGALAINEQANWKSVFIGSFLISRQFIANLADYANIWCLTEPGIVTAVNDKILMLHPLKTGPVKVNLKTAAGLQELPGGNNVNSPKAKTHNLKLEAGKTYLIRLENKN